MLWFEICGICEKGGFRSNAEAIFQDLEGATKATCLLGGLSTVPSIAIK